MDSVYWQVVVEEEAHKRLAFFNPGGKRQCKVMPMGDLNPPPIFVSMVMKLQMEWDTISK